MYKNNENVGVEVRVDMYTSLVQECFTVACQIQDKTKFISYQAKPEKAVSPSSGSELKMNLEELLEKLTDIRDGIQY